MFLRNNSDKSKDLGQIFITIGIFSLILSLMLNWYGLDIRIVHFIQGICTGLSITLNIGGLTMIRKYIP